MDKKKVAKKQFSSKLNEREKEMEKRKKKENQEIRYTRKKTRMKQEKIALTVENDIDQKRNNTYSTRYFYYSNDDISRSEFKCNSRR